MKGKQVKQINVFRLLALLSIIFMAASCGAGDEETKIVNNQIIVPSVLDVLPDDASSDVPLNSSIVVEFSMQINESSLSTNEQDQECSGSVQVSSDNFQTCQSLTAVATNSDSMTSDSRYQYQLKPTDLLSAQTNYKVKLTTDIKSLNNIAILNEYVTPNGFTTGDHVTVPIVESNSPLDDAVHIGVDRTVKITFSEEMDPQSFSSDNFQVVNEGGTAITGSIGIDGSVVEFTPDSRFEISTAYTVSLGTGITSAPGQNLIYAHDFSFTTAPVNVVVDYTPENTTEAAEVHTFTVYLSSVPTDDVFLTLGSSDTTEGTVSPTALTFTPSDWSTPQTVTLTGVDDDDLDFDGSIAYSINFQPAVSDDPDYDGFDPVDILLYNYDNDMKGVQTATVIADDGMDDDRFGSAVSLGKDIAVVGAPNSDDTGLSSGSAYVYQRNPADGSWAQTQKLVAHDAGASDIYGLAVAVDGDNIAIGSRYDDEAGTNGGAVYFYRRNGDTWDFQMKATAAGSVSSDYLGFSVSLEGDYAVVGATGKDDNGSASGAVFVFKRNTVSGSWFQVDKLLASDGAASDQFGYTVDISGDFIIIGAPFDDDTALNSGSVYIFKRNTGLDTWTEVSKVVAATPVAEDRLGTVVSIHGDYAVAGMMLDDDVAAAAGAAVVIERDSGLDTWSRHSKLTASDGMANDQFGQSVGIYEDYIAVGARYEDNANGSNAGAVYLFKLNAGTWEPQSKIVADGGLANDQFGTALSVYGGNILAGAYLNNNDNGYYAGAAFIFR